MQYIYMKQCLFQEIQDIPRRVTASHGFRRLHTVGANLGTLVAVQMYHLRDRPRDYAMTVRNIYNTQLWPRGVSLSTACDAIIRKKRDAQAYKFFEMLVMPDKDITDE